MSIVKIQELAALSAIEKKNIIYRSGLDTSSVLNDVVAPMARRMQNDTLAGLLEFTAKFDKKIPDPLILERSHLEKAYRNLAQKQPEVLAAFEKAMANIRDFHQRQLPAGFETTVAGNVLGFKFQPFDRVALYVPGGKALYPSTVMMGVAPAVIAGVKDITVLSPPSPETGSCPEIVQAMAWLAGASRILQAGGAQAVLAAAYGLPEKNLQAADYIYGPGNIYVSVAKSYVNAQNLCGIDSFAGPSEVLIIADHTANPYYLAHDLLAQAEHDENAMAILLVTDRAVAEQTARFVEEAIEKREERRHITSASMQRNGLILLVESLAEAIGFSNEFAPEHLEIQTADDEKVLAGITAAGSVFVGPWAPVAIGDYYSGTNHILPTNRGARFNSGVSVHSFFRRITYQRCSREGLERSSQPITVMSKVEGLFDEHGYSVLARFEK